MPIRPRERRLRQDIHEVFATPAGQRVLAWLMREGNILGSSLGDSPEETAANEGARNLVLKLIDRLALSMDEIREKYREEKLRDIEESSEGDDGGVTWPA